jgi:hypothetical protein
VANICAWFRIFFIIFVSYEINFGGNGGGVGDVICDDTPCVVCGVPVRCDARSVPVRCDARSVAVCGGARSVAVSGAVVDS